METLLTEIIVFYGYCEGNSDIKAGTQCDSIDDNMRALRLGFSWRAIQYRAYLLRVLCTFAVAGDKINLFGAGCADLQLGRSRKLLLVKDVALAYFRSCTEVAQESDAHRIQGHAV